MSIQSSQELAWALEKNATLQGAVVDQLRLNAGVKNISEITSAKDALTLICRHLDVEGLEFLESPDRVLVPFIFHDNALGWGVVIDQNADASWVVLAPGGQQSVSTSQLCGNIARVRMVIPDAANSTDAESTLNTHALAKSFKSRLRHVMASYFPALLEAALASIVIGFLAVATSLFTMQVYDRVIPTRGWDTLIVLAGGVLISILVELAMKYARSHIMDQVVVGMDAQLSREVFERLLRLRVDQIPSSVGSLAAQIRGYEQVRNFYTSSTLYALVDLPMAGLFVGIIVLIGTPRVAMVPLVFAVISILIGLTIRRRVMRFASEGAQFSNMKTGMLVEAVEGAETIKAGSGGWKFLSRWIDVNHLSISNDLQMRSATESIGYLSATIQQISYASLIIVGAIELMQGGMSMGALIACSILSGRILAPVAMLPSIMVQHAHADAAIKSLERLYELQTDNHGVPRPLVPSRIHGRFTLEDVKFGYGKNLLAMQVSRLEILPGERIAILGPIGAGKSTLLRLLSGMYHPQSGRVLLDGLDMSHISRHAISQWVGYLQQDHRLFHGTLRENLLIGLPDPGDDAILKVMRRTGMDRFVAMHPSGLDMPIMEGGKGLSGGQKQLVAFTRLILCDSPILLLDEPTATMDGEQERRCLDVLGEECKEGKTLVIVTHKPTILPLVNRVVVVAEHEIIADGPRDLILKQLAKNNNPPSEVPVTRSA